MTFKSKSSASLLKSFILTLVILLGATLFVSGSWLLSKNTESRSRAASASIPITGTFFLRFSAFLDSEQVVRQLLQEMRDTGIDTLIVGLGITTKDAHRYYDYNELQSGMATTHVIKLAKQYNMKLYFALGTYAGSQMDPWNDDPNDPNSRAGHLISYSLELINLLKQKTSEAGLAWNDPTIAGFYIWPESDIVNFWSKDTNIFRFFDTMSEKIKQSAPDKKIMISPWMTESTSYTDAKHQFTQIFTHTDIDIITPQDSMGTGKTQSLSRNTEHFKALHDAAVATGKEAWANIEAFQSPQGDNGKFEPTTILKLTGQIASAKPYVSKLIMFSYQHSFLSDPAFDIFATGSQILSPPHDAARRKLLRQAYLESYANASPSPLYYCDTQSYSCRQTTATYNPNHTQTDNASVTCEQNLQSYLSGKTTGSCYTTQAGCTAECAQPQLMYYCDTADNTCKQTSSQYYPGSHRENEKTAYCEDNLSYYLPGKTTGACYATASTCGSNCPLPPPPQGIKMYFCDTRDYTCKQTTNTYNPSTQVNFEGFSLCSENLSVFLPGLTTGACFSAKDACQSTCAPGITPQPTSHISPTVAPLHTPAPTGSMHSSPYTLQFVLGLWLDIKGENIGTEGQNVTVYLSHEHGNAILQGKVSKQGPYDVIRVSKSAVPNLDLDSFYNVIVIPR